jgi:uncharacterized Zn finger protein (UPF0148 family)
LYKLISIANNNVNVERWHVIQQKIHATIMVEYVSPMYDPMQAMVDENLLTLQKETVVDELPVGEVSAESVETKEPCVTKSIFANIPKKETPVIHIESDTEYEKRVATIEGEPEKEEAKCDNCGSTEVIFNASGQMLCDNCGHEEDTTLEEEEESEVVESVDETDSLLEMLSSEENTTETIIIDAAEELYETVVEEQEENITFVNDEELQHDVMDTSVDTTVVETVSDIIPQTNIADAVDILDISEHVVSDLPEKEHKKVLAEMSKLYGKEVPFNFEKTNNQINVTLVESFEQFYVTL